MPNFNMPDNCPEYIYDMYDDYDVQESKLSNIDSIVHFLEGIMEHLYGKGELDKARLEHCIDEVCYLVGVEINQGDLTIQRESSESEKRIKNLLQNQIDYTHAHAELTCKQRRVI